MIENSLEEIDLRIFKVLTSNQRMALEFVASNSKDLFIGDASDIGEILFDYVSSYKNIPTKRILVEKYPDISDKITETFDQLESLEFNAVEYSHDVERIRNRYVELKIAEVRDGFTYDFEEHDAKDLVEKLQYALKDIQKVNSDSKQAYNQKPIREYVAEFKEDYVARMKDPNLGQGILTGYSYLDYVTNGIAPGELVIIGAETNAGKSMLLSNIAIQMWMQKNTLATDPKEYSRGCNVLYFSLEMPYKPCFRRTMARLADVPLYGLRDSTLNKIEADAVSQASRFISKYPYEFEIVDIPRGVTTETIEERFLEAKTRYLPDVVCIDYLGLMEDNDVTGEDWLKLGHIAGKVHELARVYGIRIITAVQLNRLSQQKKKPEPHEIVGVHRFGRSSLMAHHANICIQIESRPDENRRQDLIYHIIKNRDGEKGSHTIMKNFAHAAIYDVPYTPPDSSGFGSLVSDFGDPADISEEISKILGFS